MYFQLRILEPYLGDLRCMGYAGTLFLNELCYPVENLICFKYLGRRETQIRLRVKLNRLSASGGPRQTKVDIYFNEFSAVYNHDWQCDEQTE